MHSCDNIFYKYLCYWERFKYVYNAGKSFYIQARVELPTYTATFNVIIF